MEQHVRAIVHVEIKDGMSKRPKRPRDPVQLGKLIGDILTGQVEDVAPVSDKNIHASRAGHLGGIKGGKARAASLSPKERSEAAKRAAKARWSKS